MSSFTFTCFLKTSETFQLWYSLLLLLLLDRFLYLARDTFLAN